MSVDTGSAIEPIGVELQCQLRLSLCQSRRLTSARLSVRRKQEGAASVTLTYWLITSTRALYLEQAYVRSHAVQKSSTITSFNQLSKFMYENCIQVVWIITSLSIGRIPRIEYTFWHYGFTIAVLLPRQLGSLLEGLYSLYNISFSYQVHQV